MQEKDGLAVRADLRFAIAQHPRGYCRALEVADLLPAVVPAGTAAGTLTAAGAAILDPTGTLEPGALVCPPEGDAGTGMVVTNSVRPRTGNVSAGTSVFAMLVLERKLSQVHPEIDLVLDASGRTSKTPAWLAAWSAASTLTTCGPFWVR